MIQNATDTIIPGIMVFAVIQGVVLMFFLLRLRQGSQLGHRMLAFLIFSFIVTLLSELYDYFNEVVYESFEDDLLIMLQLTLWLTLSPLIYLYTDVITRRDKHVIDRSFWLHFSPSVFYLVGSILLIQRETNIQVELDTWSPFSWFLILFLSILFVQIPVYLFVSYKKLWQHKHHIEALFSATERINLHWIRNLLVGFTFLYLTLLCFLFTEDMSVIDQQVNNILILLVVALVYVFGYMGIQQADIFGKEVSLGNDMPLPKSSDVFDSHHDVNHTPKIIPSSVNHLAKNDDMSKRLQEKDVPEEDAKRNVSETLQLSQNDVKNVQESPDVDFALIDRQKEKQRSEKYQKSALDKETSQLLFDDLLAFMEENKPYLENDISLSGLAKSVNLSPNYLSQIINEQSQSNFFDFINRYRVNHFKTLLAEQLKENKTSNMIDMALASGFNSKSAFYSAFKKYEGMTPSQYKKSLHENKKLIFNTLEVISVSMSVPEFSPFPHLT